MTFAVAHGCLEGLLSDVAGGPQIGCDVSGSGVVPVQGGAGAGQGAVHALLQGLDAGCGRGVGSLRILAATQIGVGHRGDLALHLVEHQQAVGQHPAAIRRCTLGGRMHRHAGFDPADQLVAPEAKQLAHRWQTGDRRAG